MSIAMGMITGIIITGITTIMTTITTMITARNCRKPPSGCVRWKPFCWPKAMSIPKRWI
jgi:heme/copper-type cytochrome/quinol oxidase subunit 1